MDAIRLENVKKSYPTGHIIQTKFLALKGVSFTVQQSETFGLLGHNGAGKTTIFKILNGLIRPDEGYAYIFDKPAGSLEAKSKIGFLPENPYFYTYLTPMELLTFFGELSGLNHREIIERAHFYLKLVGMEKWKNVQIKKFSKGMVQRVGMAQALISDPNLLILDEPMTGLDPVGRKELKEIILQLKEEGKTIIFSSHILSDVEMICDQVAIIIKGEVVEKGDLKELLLEKTTGYEIEFPSSAINWLTGKKLNFKKVGSTIVIEVSDKKEAVKILKDAVIDGIEIVSFLPKRVQLEDLFMEEYRKHEKSKSGSN